MIAAIVARDTRRLLAGELLRAGWELLKTTACVYAAVLVFGEIRKGARR